MTIKSGGVSSLALAAVLAFAVTTPSTVNAGGISLKDTPAPAPVALWAGCYIGVHAGGAWEDDGEIKEFKKKSSQTVTETFQARTTTVYESDGWYLVEDFDDEDDDDTSFVGGIHKGCNWQDGQFVYGLEGDISFGDTIDYLGSIRARLGWSVDQLLLYVTAGVAFIGTDDEFDVSYGGYDWSFEDDDNETGFVVGLGFEKKFGTNWSFGVEGLYYVFGDNDTDYQWSDGAERGYYDFYLEREKDNDLFVIRARLNYHIGRDVEPLPSLK